MKAMRESQQKNAAGTVGSVADWTAFSHVASTLNWPYAAHAMNGDDVLIADPKTQQALEGHKPENGPRFMAPDTAMQEVGQIGGQVFVLMASGEKEFVRRLERKLSGATIVSVTYDAAATIPNLRELVKGLRFSFLFASPGSGSDYVADLMQANRMATTIDLFDSITAAWIGVAEDFDPVRFAASKIPGLDSTATKGKVCVRLPIDCLEVMRKRRLFLPKSIKMYSMLLNARCIYMMRRSKADQAALLRIAREYPPEISREPAKAGAKYSKSKKPPSEDLLPIALDLMEMEVRFEKFLGNLPQLRVLTFEEARTSPVEILNMMAAFLGSGLLRKVNVLDVKPYDFAPKWCSRSRKQFKEDVESFFGLEINDVGSYSPVLAGKIGDVKR